MLHEDCELLIKSKKNQNYNHYSVSHLVRIGKQHSIYEVFTAKVGKVAGEGKIVRSGSEVITGSSD